MSRSKQGKRQALGRGLGALIPEAKSPRRDTSEADPSPSEARPAGPQSSTGLKQLPIERLHPGPAQPRRRFDEDALEELAVSIRNYGLIQPIVATPRPNTPGHYDILAGERRWRAAQRAGLHDVPVVVRDTESSRHLELALIENLQRSDLTPIEEARAYASILDLHGYTHAEMADRVGKDRSTVSNALRLLKLPTSVQDMLQEGRLGMGHARALLPLEDPPQIIALAKRAASTDMSVRAVESEVRKRLRAAEAERPDDEDADERRRHAIIISDLETRLARVLGAKVKLKTGRKRRGPGKVEINYASLDDLNRILHVLMGTKGEG